MPPSDDQIDSYRHRLRRRQERGGARQGDHRLPLRQQLRSAWDRPVLRHPGAVRQEPGRGLRHRQHHGDQPRRRGCKTQYATQTTTRPRAAAAQSSSCGSATRTSPSRVDGDRDVRDLLRHRRSDAERSPNKNPPYDEFYWDATGFDWTASIKQVDDHRHACPTGCRTTTCFVGKVGSTRHVLGKHLDGRGDVHGVESRGRRRASPSAPRSVPAWSPTTRRTCSTGRLQADHRPRRSASSRPASGRGAILIGSPHRRRVLVAQERSRSPLRRVAAWHRAAARSERRGRGERPGSADPGRRSHRRGSRSPRPACSSTVRSTPARRPRRSSTSRFVARLTVQSSGKDEFTVTLVESRGGRRTA